MSLENVTIVGKIKSVAVKDFVTYDVAKFYPDENLNIIIGPNGTGKSTIVAAIVLGMGGHCRLLSRSGSIEDYIKNGKDMAKIEISIYKNVARKTITFNRIFDRARKDSFEVDGVKVNQKEYMKQITKFKIQIDNLCQFLPQDRVQDFAKMNPRELLINTQSSVCSPQIAEAMEKLIGMRLEQKNLTKNNADDVTKLKEAEAKNEELRVQIKNMQARNQFEEKIVIGIARKAWLEYEILYKNFVDTKSDIKLAKKNLDDKENKLEPLKTKAEVINKTKLDLSNKIKNEQSAVQSTATALNAMETKSEGLEDSVNQHKQILQDAILQANDRDSDLQEAKTMMAVFIQDCKNAHTQAGSEEAQKRKKEEMASNLSKCKKENELLMSRRNELNQKIENDLKPEMVSVTRRIELLENVGQMKLKSLQSKYEHTYLATLWLRDNKHLFQGTVYEPIMLEINVLDTANAKYLENTIAKRDLIAFTCERKDDMALFIKKVRVEQRWKDVNVVQSDAASEVQFEPHIPIQSLKHKFGFHSYLIDMIEGPAPILNYLCKLNNIHNVPVGTNDTQKFSSQVPDQIHLFFTPNHRFSVTKSKYSGAKSSKCDEIREHHFLNKTVDQEALSERKATHTRLVKECDKIRNHRNEIENQIKAIQERCNAISIEKRQLDDNYNHFMQCKSKLTRQKAKVDELQNRKIDVDEEKGKFRQRVEQVLDKLVECQLKKVIDLNKYLTATTKYEVNKEKLNIFLQQNADIESEIRSAEDAVNSARQAYSRVDSRIEDLKNKLKSKQIEAKGLTNNLTPSSEHFPYKTEFEKLPHDLSEMQAHIEEMQARVDCMSKNSDNIVEDFETRAQMIDQLKESINNAQRSNANLEEEMHQLHGQWYPEIDRIVSIINRNFSKFMSTMGFSGEVEITKKDERDYAEYGIQIRVKYRNNEKLQALDRHVQSGGERAVAIAIYTLSLQHITHVPFRCVDEINQGMDPRNERKIFEMLVEETCREGQSQYFFITPKLLPNLKYNDLMSVFIVHNGKFIQNPHLFVLKQIEADKRKVSR